MPKITTLLVMLLVAEVLAQPPSPKELTKDQLIEEVAKVEKELKAKQDELKPLQDRLKVLTQKLGEMEDGEAKKKLVEKDQLAKDAYEKAPFYKVTMDPKKVPVQKPVYGRAPTHVVFEMNHHDSIHNSPQMPWCTVSYDIKEAPSFIKCKPPIYSPKMLYFDAGEIQITTIDCELFNAKKKLIGSMPCYFRGEKKTITNKELTGEILSLQDEFTYTLPPFQRRGVGEHGE